MIHGYHVIWGTYGFWLPNDPRGSWSDFVASWELVRFGKATRGHERRKVNLAEWAQWRASAQKSLPFPPVVLTGEQALRVEIGFSNAVHKSNYTIRACSILPEHVHLVIARHTYKVETIANLLKGEATKRLRADALHPQAGYKDKNGKQPAMWAEGKWKVYLDTDTAIENAIHSVEENPAKEGKPPQKWSFVRPFGGIDNHGWTTYH